MKENPWVSASKIKEHLGVSEKTLQFWREIGYLKPGTHWRTSPRSLKNPWKPEVVYHLNWCKEEMDYWRAHDARISGLAA